MWRLAIRAAEPVPAGVRNAGAGERRMLLELHPLGREHTPLQLDLRVRREPAGGVEMAGQLLPPWVGAPVEVRRAGSSKRRREPYRPGRR